MSTSANIDSNVVVPAGETPIEDANASASDSEVDSPTSVHDRRLLTTIQHIASNHVNSSISSNNNNNNNNNSNSTAAPKKESTDSTGDDNVPFLPLVPVHMQRAMLETFSNAQSFVEESYKNFVLDRKSITSLVLCCLASFIGCITLFFIAFGGLAVVTCPLWVPVALVFSPLWFPIMLCTSPVWVTAGVTVLGCCLCSGLALLVTIFFFVWPEEWLPSKESNGLVKGYLHQRDHATRTLAAWQAKIVLYAAGAGPAADALILILERIDLQNMVQNMQKVDWADLGKKVQKMELHEVQETAFKLFRSLIR